MATDIRDILPDHFNEEFDLAPDYCAEEDYESTIKSEQDASDAHEHIKTAIRKHSLTHKRANASDEENMLRARNRQELEYLRDEAGPEAISYLSRENSDISPYAGTTQTDVVKMLTGLGINANIYLTRSDTYNLLSCLLTCNETQLQAIYNNPKTPLAIKTVVLRLIQDAGTGDISTIERLWDRIFGKAMTAASLEMPQSPVHGGIIPKTVVSREAYTIIRDTIIG